jgi:hypothetical protein
MSLIDEATLFENKRMGALEKYLDVFDIDEVEPSGTPHYFHHKEDGKEYLVRTQEECIDWIRYVLTAEFMDSLHDFSEISKITNVPLQEVEGFFLADVIINSDSVLKDSGDFYATGIGVKKFIEGKVSFEDYMNRTVELEIKDERQDVDKFVDGTYLDTVDDFHIYLTTTFSIFSK